MDLTIFYFEKFKKYNLIQENNQIQDQNRKAQYKQFYADLNSLIEEQKKIHDEHTFLTRYSQTETETIKIYNEAKFTDLKTALGEEKIKLQELIEQLDKNKWNDNSPNGESSSQ